MKDLFKQNIGQVVVIIFFVGVGWTKLSALEGNTVNKQVYEAEKLGWKADMVALKLELKEVKELNNKIIVDIAVIATDVKHIRTELDRP